MSTLTRWSLRDLERRNRTGAHVCVRYGPVCGDAPERCSSSTCGRFPAPFHLRTSVALGFRGFVRTQRVQAVGDRLECLPSARHGCMRARNTRNDSNADPDRFAYRRPVPS